MCAMVSRWYAALLALLFCQNYLAVHDDGWQSELNLISKPLRPLEAAVKGTVQAAMAVKGAAQPTRAVEGLSPPTSQGDQQQRDAPKTSVQEPNTEDLAEEAGTPYEEPTKVAIADDAKTPPVASALAQEPSTKEPGEEAAAPGDEAAKSAIADAGQIALVTEAFEELKMRFIIGLVMFAALVALILCLAMWPRTLSDHTCVDPASVSTSSLENARQRGVDETNTACSPTLRSARGLATTK